MRHENGHSHISTVAGDRWRVDHKLQCVAARSKLDPASLCHHPYPHIQHVRLV